MDIPRNSRNVALALIFVAMLFMAPLATLGVQEATAQETQDPATEPPAEPASNHEEDPFWLTLDGFSTKSGYRMVFIWQAAEPISGIVRWGFSPDALDNVAIPVGSTVDQAQMAFMDTDRSNIGKRVYWDVLDQVGGTVSPTQSFRLGNAWNSPQAADGTYTINAVLQLDAQSLPDDVPFDAGLTELARGIDILSERIWDFTDGHARIGKVVVTDTALQYPVYQPSGPGVCTDTQDVEGVAVQHTLADFVVQTTIPFDSHTFGGGIPVIDDPCTAFYIGRIGQLVVPWESDAHLGYVMAHELGHYAFGLPDLYDITFAGGCANRDEGHVAYDVSIMHNSGGWTGARWDLTELDRGWTDCDRSVGDQEVSWDEFQRWYPAVPDTTAADIDRSDSDATKLRDNPDGGALNVYIMDQEPGRSGIDHFIVSETDDEGDPTVGPDVQIVSPSSGNTVAPSVLDISGSVDRAGDGNKAPVATLSADPTSGDAPLNVSFALGGSDSDGTVTQWSFDAGDGSPAVGGSGLPPTSRGHTYTADGTYPATLTLTDDTGRTGTAEAVVVVGGGGAHRIGTDPAGDAPTTGTCGSNAAQCEHSWTADAAPGLDLVASYVEDLGNDIRFSWEVVDSDKFFVDPSGDPAAADDESHITGYQITTGFSTSPATTYRVALERARGTSDLTASLSKEFVVLASGSPVGVAGHDPARDLFWVDMPKDQFPELGAISTLSDLRSLTETMQYGTGSVYYLGTKDTLDRVEDDEYTLRSTLDPLGYGPSLMVSPQSPPTTVPSDPEVTDGTGDAFIGGAVIGHTDIEAAWFEHDADFLYVGLKVVDIPADTTTTSNIAYHVNFHPDWTSARWGLSTEDNFDGLSVHASLDPTRQQIDHYFDLRARYTDAAGARSSLVAELPLSSIDATTDIIWFVVPRAALQDPTPGATISDFSADTRLSTAVVNVGVSGILTDTAAANKPDYALAPTMLPLGSSAGGPYEGLTGQTVSLTGTAQGGTTPYTCSWSTDADGGFTDPSSCSTSISFASAGDKIVRLSVTDGNNATSNTTGLVTVRDPTDERVDLTLSGDLIASVSVLTGDGRPAADWQRQVDMTGRSGEHTLVATWRDADDAILDVHTIDIVVGPGPAPFVTIDTPRSRAVVSGVVDVTGTAGHGADDAGASEPTMAFGPDGLFQEQAFVQRSGHIAAFCSTCEGVTADGAEVYPPDLFNSVTWLSGNPGGTFDGVDGRWFDVSGFVGTQYELSTDGGSPADIWFFNTALDPQADATGHDAGPDATKAGLVPPGSNWAFVYLRRPTAENATSLPGVDDVANLKLTPPLSAPRALTGTTAWDSTRVTWEAPEWDGGSAITGYKVYRDGALVATLSDVQRFEESGLTPGQTYDYTIGAINAAGTEGPLSVALSLTTGNDFTSPAPVSGLAVTDRTAHSIAIDWTAATDAESGISHYRVSRDGIHVGTTTTTAYSESGLSEDTAYVYEVVAVNGQGLTSTGSSISVTTTTIAVIETVTLYANGTAVGNVTIDTGDTSAPWTVQWDTRYLDDGIHTIQAVYDNGRGATELVERQVEVDNVPLKPDVTIASPAEGAVKQTPIRLEGDWTTIGDQSAPLGSSPARSMHPGITGWFEDAWVQKTLYSVGFDNLLGQLGALDGYLAAYPSAQTGQAIVVLLEGPVPSDAPTSGLGVPIRYITNVAPEPLLRETEHEFPTMSLEEFESWSADFRGPLLPGIQQGAGPGSAIQFKKPGSTSTWVCSTSYLYDDPTTDTYYLSTAGHCLYDSASGDSNSNPENRDEWVSICVADCVSNTVGAGTYVRLEPEGDYHPVAYAIAQGVGKDFGLIEIPESLYDHLRPWMTLWGGPTKFERPLLGDPLAHYGHGVGIGTAPPTQGRLAVNLDTTKDLGIFAAGWVMGGDSGSSIGTAMPRTDDLLVGDGASGAITHSVIEVGLPLLWGTDLERGLEMANMTHLRLVTEDEEIRAPSTVDPDPTGDLGAQIASPAEGTILDRFTGAPIQVTGTATVNATGQPNGTESKRYYLHRDACGDAGTLWMDEILLPAEHGGNACGSLLMPANPVLGAYVDAYPADPLPAETIYVDPARPIKATVYQGGYVGEEPKFVDIEFRLSYGGTIVAETRLVDTLHLTGPFVVEMEPLVDTIPAAAPLEFSVTVHRSATPLFFPHGGSNPSNVEIPLAIAPDIDIQLSVDDPAFNASALVPTVGTESWSAAWNISDLENGNHTLYARALVDGVQQGPTANRTVEVTGTPPPTGPSASFTSSATDLTVQFNDTSLAGSSPIASRTWDFGDGETSTERDPLHTYAADGTYTVTLTVTDANGLTDSASATVSVEMGIVEYFVQVRLVGPAGEAIGWTDVATPLEGESGDWELLWDPATRPAEGNYTIEVRMLRDGVQVASNTSQFVVDINVAPVFDPIPDQGVEENSPLSFDVTALDEDGDIVSLSAWDLPAGASFTDNGDNTGTFTWTPDTGTHGTYDVTFTAQDAEYNVSTQVSIFVWEEEMPPVLDPIADQTLAEGERLTVPITGMDLNGDALTLSVAPLPTGAKVIKQSAGHWTLEWTPGYRQHGDYALVATLSDGTFSVTDGFNITVTDVDVPPQFTNVPDVTVIVGKPTASYVAAKDLDGDTVALSASGLPSWAGFTDLGSGQGRLELSAPPHEAGRSYTVTLTANSTDQGTSSTFVLNAIGYMDLSLKSTGSGFSDAYPGKQHALGVRVTNSGNAPGWVHFQGNVPTSGWSVSPPADVYLEAGESRILPFNVTPGSTGSSGQVTLKVVAKDFANTQASTQFIVRIPVVLSVDLNTTSAVFGTEGVVQARFLDGSPVADVAMTVTDVHQLGSPFVNTATGTTDADGRFTFRFDMNSEGGQLVGDHTLFVQGVRDGRTDSKTTAYTVTV